MRHAGKLIVVLSALACGVACLAAPIYTTTVAKVAGGELRMATDDILQNKPFVFESKDGYFFWRGIYNPETVCLTDAAADGPFDDICCQGSKQYSFRWLLGSLGPQGRRLDSITLTWKMNDSARNGIHVQFFAHDVNTRQWTAITDPVVLTGEHSQDGYYKTLTITFQQPSPVINFDALRMIDLNTNGTRWVEVDAMTYPNNR